MSSLDPDFWAGWTAAVLVFCATKQRPAWISVIMGAAMTALSMWLKRKT